MEVDDRPWLRRTSHGMGHDISPPRDCDSTVSLRLRTSDNGNRVTDRWRTIVTKISNGIRKRKIPPRSNKHRDMVAKTTCATGNRSRNLCYDSWSLSHLGYLYPGTTLVMIKLDHNRTCPWVWIAQVTKAPSIMYKPPCRRAPNLPRQSFVNQRFLRTFERLFLKKKHERRSPSG